jgi:hypothetical protein
MGYICTNCKKLCRDNYDLKRHQARKIPCVLVPKQENVNNFYITINMFGNEDLSHIKPERIIEKWRQINKADKEEYNRAGKLVLTFHELVNENPTNKNVKLSNIKSPVVSIITPQGTITQSTNETLNKTIKTRAGQLVTFKEGIHEQNKSVFKSKNNLLTWRHIEKFNSLGMAHTNTYDNTRTLRTNMRIALMDKNEPKGEQVSSSELILQENFDFFNKIK